MCQTGQSSRRWSFKNLILRSSPSSRSPSSPASSPSSSSCCAVLPPPAGKNAPKAVHVAGSNAKGRHSTAARGYLRKPSSSSQLNNNNNNNNNNNISDEERASCVTASSSTLAYDPSEAEAEDVTVDSRQQPHMRRMRSTPARRASASTATASSASVSSASSSQLSRRSSLKKTSTYGPHRAAAATASSMMPRSASLSHLPRSVSFNTQVEMALVDYVEDICPRAPRRLFYSDADYARMKSDRQHDARRILLEKEEREIKAEQHRRQQLRNLKTSSYFFQQPSDKEKEIEPSQDHSTTDNKNNDYDYDQYDDIDDDDNDDDESTCEFGIDHLICTRDERNGRIRRARSVLVAVLDEQERADNEEEPTTVAGGAGTERRAARLARASLKASQVARIQAIERAAEVEEHCAKMRQGRRHSSAGAAEEGRPLPLQCSRRASCA